jgi:hypothetical protein
MWGAEDHLSAEIGWLKLRVEVLEQDSRRLSEATEVAKQDIGTALAQQSAK